MRYTKEARIRFHGDREKAASYVSFARTLLGELYQRNHAIMDDRIAPKLSDSQISNVDRRPIEQSKQEFHHPDGTKIVVNYNNWMPVIDIYAPSGRVERKVLFKAKIFVTGWGDYRSSFDPDEPAFNMYLAMGEDSTFQKYAGVDDPPTGVILNVLFSPNGEFLVVTGTDEPYMWVYKRKEGTPRYTRIIRDEYVLPTYPYLGLPGATETYEYGGVAYASTFSPDGKYLLLSHAPSVITGGPFSTGMETGTMYPRLYKFEYDEDLETYTNRYNWPATSDVNPRSLLTTLVISENNARLFAGARGVATPTSWNHPTAYRWNILSSTYSLGNFQVFKRVDGTDLRKAPIVFSIAETPTNSHIMLSVIDIYGEQDTSPISFYDLAGGTFAYDSAPIIAPYVVMHSFQSVDPRSLSISPDKNLLAHAHSHSVFNLDTTGGLTVFDTRTMPYTKIFVGGTRPSAAFNSSSARINGLEARFFGDKHLFFSGIIVDQLDITQHIMYTYEYTKNSEGVYSFVKVDLFTPKLVNPVTSSTYTEHTDVAVSMETRYD